MLGVVDLKLMEYGHIYMVSLLVDRLGRFGEEQ